MDTSPFQQAAHVLASGGLGFVPLSVRCNMKVQEALRALDRLEYHRQDWGAEFEDARWGYQADDKGQYDKGLSQWRDDERKTIFHYSSAVPEVLKDLGAPVENWRAFFEPCEYVFRACHYIGMAVARELDLALPGYNFESSCEAAGIENQNLRLLSYEPRTGTAETAKSHQDRCLITLHVYQSAPGLYVGPDKDTKLRVDIPQGHVAVFLGRKAEQMTDGKVSGLWHGTEEVRALEPEGRRAMVFFLHSNVPLIRRPGEL